MSKIVWWWGLRRMTHHVYMSKLAYRAWAKYATDAFNKVGTAGSWKLERNRFPPTYKYRH